MLTVSAAEKLPGRSPSCPIILHEGRGSPTQRGVARLISTRLPRWGVASAALAADVVVVAALYGLAGLFPSVLYQASDSSVANAFTALGSGIAMAAAILLALAAWLSTNGQAIRIAFAVMVYEAFLLMDALEPGPTSNEPLVSDLALIGVAVLCGLGLRGEDGGKGAWRTSTLISISVIIGCAIAARMPDLAPAAWLRHTLDVSAWTATATAGLALMHYGLRDGVPVSRRVGLALLTLTAAPVLRAAHALSPDQPSLTVSALGLAGVAMLLAAAAPFAVGALRTVLRELADSQTRLDAAEKAMATTAVRDHEMRNLVAGLSGAESVLAAQEAKGDSPESRRQLRAAARAELERLRRMLDSKGIEFAPVGASCVAVTPLLSDLAALHGATGAAIELNLGNDLHALVPPECLAHIVTNLLVNCARHAPGARVWLTASRRADRVVIEVTDDGPGLPPDLSAELLQPGTRGPSSTGTGLGLHVSAESASRYGGTIRLVPAPVDGRGCTVVVELPVADADARPSAKVTL